MTFHVLKVDPSRTQKNVSLEIFISRVFQVLLLFIDVYLFSENRIHFEYITLSSHNALSPDTGINEKTANLCIYTICGIVNIRLPHVLSTACQYIQVTKPKNVVQKLVHMYKQIFSR